MITEVLQRIQAIVPIYPGTAEPDATLPYATYTESSTPIVTFDGIAGYEDSFSVAVVANSKLSAERLRDAIIAAVHGIRLNDIVLYYQDSTYVDYADMGISSYEINFNVLK